MTTSKRPEDHEAELPGKADSPPSPEGGQMIGPYRIISVLGEGGMGTVYLAEQREPVRRRVALKLIKLGMDSKEVIRRFEAERQALAMMEHSHIAKVFDTGTTQTGQPYFVMEYVRGIPITEHCNKHRVSIDERIELFRQICSGVQHAHQKGVMHRDLKPSNILVSVQEGKPVPKIIDFGIARATAHSLTQTMIVTEQGQILGTPEYMSPEQAGMDGQDVDTRTDVYSLGVILYELCVGDLPFSEAELRQAGYGEMQRKIKEDDPPKPSTRLSTNSETCKEAARQRATDAHSLLRRMRRDLDWVVMRAIEKDRTRRYETPAALAEDLKRHLDLEPVLAGPPGASYRIKKMIRKYRGQVTAAALVLLALIGGIIGTMIGFARARENATLATARASELKTALNSAQAARAAEEEQRKFAEAETLRAKAAELETERRATELAQVVAFQEAQLSDVNPEEMGMNLRKSVIAATEAVMRSSSLDQETIKAQQETISRLLAKVNFTNLALDTLDTNIFARALTAIDQQFKDQPLVSARLMQAEADILRELGLLARAVAPQTRALALRRRELGDDHPDTLESIRHIAALLQIQGKLTEAERYGREALSRHRRVYGDDHPGTLAAVNSMGTLLNAQGKIEEAESYYRESLDGQRRILGDDHEDTLGSISNLSLLLQTQGKFAEAERLGREALAGNRRMFGEDHPRTLVAINNLGSCLEAQGKLTEAEPYYRDALRGHRRALGDNHPNTLISINNLSTFLQAQGKFASAEPLCLEALEGRRRVLGEDHPSTLKSLSNMGLLLLRQGRFAEAEPYCRDALEGRRRILGNDHPDTLVSINNMGGLHDTQGKHAEAEPYYREALETRRRLFGPDHPDTLVSANNMGMLLAAQNKFADAEPFLRDALERSRRVFGEEHPRVADSFRNLAILLESMNDFEALVDLCETWGKHDLADKWQARLDKKK